MEKKRMAFDVDLIFSVFVNYMEIISGSTLGS